MQHPSDLADGVPESHSNTGTEGKSGDHRVFSIGELEVSDAYNDFTQGYA